MKFDENIKREGLFQIGDLVKCCGIDRQTILFYERKGLIAPTAKNESSGYRYYSVDSVTEIMQILQFKDMGFSLKEIKIFKENGALLTENVINKMEEKIAALMDSLEQIKAINVKKGNYSVVLVNLPATRCFCKEYYCENTEQAVNYMYKAFQDALSCHFLMRNAYRIYAEFPDIVIGDEISMTNFKLRVYIPVAADTVDPDCMEVAASCGLSVCHRGDYADINNAYSALWSYAKKYNYILSGAPREYYLESKKEYQNDTDRYVTRIVLPVLNNR